MRLLWLPDVLRGAGLRVHLVDGWETRGNSSFDPRGLICHATAGARGARAADEIRVLLNGSATAPPPIAQLYLARDGAFHVVASGRCNHALTGWAGLLKGLGNTNLVGIEAGNDNRGEPWPAVQLDAYHRGVAAICGRMRWTERQVAAHREHQPYPPPPGITSTKSDPHGIEMGQFRRTVAALLAGESDPKEVTVIRIKAKDAPERYLSNGAHIPSMTVDAALERAGVPLVEVATTRDALALLPPSTQLDYDKLAAALLRQIPKAGT